MTGTNFWNQMTEKDLLKIYNQKIGALETHDGYKVFLTTTKIAGDYHTILYTVSKQPLEEKDKKKSRVLSEGGYKKVMTSKTERRIYDFYAPQKGSESLPDARKENEVVLHDLTPEDKKSLWAPVKDKFKQDPFFLFNATVSKLYCINMALIPVLLGWTFTFLVSSKTWDLYAKDFESSWHLFSLIKTYPNIGYVLALLFGIILYQILAYDYREHFPKPIWAFFAIGKVVLSVYTLYLTRKFYMLYIYYLAKKKIFFESLDNILATGSDYIIYFPNTSQELTDAIEKHVYQLLAQTGGWDRIPRTVQKDIDFIINKIINTTAEAFVDIWAQPNIKIETIPQKIESLVEHMDTASASVVTQQKQILEAIAQDFALQSKTQPGWFDFSNYWHYVASQLLTADGKQLSFLGIVLGIATTVAVAYIGGQTVNYLWTNFKSNQKRLADLESDNKNLTDENKANTDMLAELQKKHDTLSENVVKNGTKVNDTTNMLNTSVSNLANETADNTIQIKAIEQEIKLLQDTVVSINKVVKQLNENVDYVLAKCL